MEVQLRVGCTLVQRKVKKIVDFLSTFKKAGSNMSLSEGTDAGKEISVETEGK